MNAARRQCDDDITLLDTLRIDHALRIDQSGTISGQIIFIFRIKPGHLSRLTADQRCPGLHAALGHTGYDLFDHFGVVFAACNIIQEKQGFCPAADDIVDTHGHAVDPDRVMLVH